VGHRSTGLSTAPLFGARRSDRRADAGTDVGRL